MTIESGPDAIGLRDGLISSGNQPKLGEILVERGLITAQELAMVLGLQRGMSYVDTNTYPIQAEALRLLPEALARKLDVIPLAIRNGVLEIAVADPNSVQAVEEAIAESGLEIEAAIAMADEIRAAITRYYSGLDEWKGQFSGASTSISDSGSVIEAVIDDEDDGIELKQAEPEPQVATQQPDDSESPPNKSSFDLSTFPIEPEALKLIPESIARKYNVIPVSVTNGSLKVAMVDAYDVLTLEALAACARKRIEPLTAASKAIQEAIDRNYKEYGEIQKQFGGAPVSLPDEKEDDEDISTEAIAGAPAVRALYLIVDEAIKKRASDIHIEPMGGKLRLRYRVDGVMQEILSLPLSAHPPIMSRLKILANMNIADHHRPQDGQFSVKARGREVDIRVATVATSYGEMAVLRILDKSFAALSLGELGFSTGSFEQYQNMLKAPFGMNLISGPTGSGKTTTLYASLGNLDCKGRTIITIEDPVEYRFEDINQIQVNPRAGLTFASGLRSIMRLDPDVILVGEIRDPETAEIAVQAALTGHLVLASIHANDAVGSLFRLLDLGVPAFLVASALIGCVAQRMVRRVCAQCGRPTEAPLEAQLAYNREMGEQRKKFVYGSGCNACGHTGYSGRVAAFEIMRISDEVRRLILAGSSAGQVRAQAKEDGMVSMWHDGMLKVKDGVTTPSEVLRNVFSIG